MRFIVMTGYPDGGKIYVNPEKICSISSLCESDATIIQFEGDERSYIMVLESPETIVKIIEGDRWIRC